MLPSPSDDGFLSPRRSLAAAASPSSTMRLGSKKPLPSLAMSSDLAGDDVDGDDGDVAVDDASHSHGVLLSRTGLLVELFGKKI